MAEIRFGSSGIGDRLEFLLEVVFGLNAPGKKTTNRRERILLSRRSRCGEECGKQNGGGKDAEEMSVEGRRHQGGDSNSFGGDGCVEGVEIADSLTGWRVRLRLKC
jgi:hypothetical protein